MLLNSEMSLRYVQIHAHVYIFTDNNKLFGKELKVALRMLGRKFYKGTKKSSLYTKSLLIFIHKTPVVENHPTTREIRE